MDYEVIRSAKRRKSIEARLVNGVLQISIPGRLSKAEEAHWVKEMVGRFERKRQTEPIDLSARAEALAARHGLEHPASIRWVDNQEWRWGSCTPEDRTVRISSKLAPFPGWVLDYVLVHELAHLSVGPHNDEFWALVNRFPKSERARGFLIARGLDDSMPPEATQPDAAPRYGGLNGPRPRPRAASRPMPAGAQPTLW
jgi:predicted metal-dependent hydrolase